MPTTCIIPAQAEKLKKALKSGEISFQYLFSPIYSTTKRVEFLKKYIGDSASLFNANLEKTFIAPNQKLAVRNFIYREIGQGKPLYKGVSLEQAEKMSSLKMTDLRKMPPEERFEVLKKYVDEKTAQNLNERFESSRKTNNLANWEERTLGTKELRENQKLKGALARLESLDDMGVLNPKQLEDYMQGFIEIKLGAELTLAEAKKLSGLVNKQRDIYDRLMASNDWTGANYKDNRDYRLAVHELTKYTESLRKEVSPVSIGNELVEIARNNLLGSPYSGVNSILYQAIPSTERTLTKRLVPATLRMEGSLLDKVVAKLQRGLFADKQGQELIKAQFKLGMDIYDKTSVDISRMTTLNDSYSYFGEIEKRAALPLSSLGSGLKDLARGVKEAPGVKDKIGAIVKGWSEISGNFPKWFAGGTDSVIAQRTRAGTSVLWPQEIARFRARTGQLPKGMTEKEYALQLFKDSYSPNATGDALRVRSAGIMDAHFSNSTQPEGLGDYTSKIRDSLSIKGFKIGRGIAPFVKITSTTLGRGLEAATGIGLMRNGANLIKATKIKDPIDAAIKMNESLSQIIGYLGIPLTALILASRMDTDDYILPYHAMTSAQREMATAQGARPGDIKIFGRWLPIKYFPMVSFPLAAEMMARQYKERGDDQIAGYIAGVLFQFRDLPVISDMEKQWNKLGRAANEKTLKGMLEKAKFNTDDIWEWARVRIMPAILSRDLYNAVLPTTKYNFLGEEVDKGRIFREDKTNELLLEFSRLDKAGFMPTITLSKEQKESLDASKLAEFQRKYAERVNSLINSSEYKGLSDKDKKNRINKIRKEEILDKLN